MKSITAIKSMAIAGALAMSIALVGCGGGQKPAETKTEEKTTQTQQQNTQKTEDTNKTSEQSGGQNTDQSSSSSQNTSNQTQAPAQTTQTEQQISADEAKSIALADAGVTAADVRDLKAERDTDDAVAHYDVDFKVGNTEHDYDIDVHTGKIISHNTEIDND